MIGNLEALLGGRTIADAMPGPPARARYHAEVMRDAPVAYWPMQDASGNPVDVSGNGRDMTSVTGTPTYRQTGPMNDYSIRIEGGEALNRSAHVSTVTSGFTMEMFVKMPQSPTDGQLFTNGNEASNGWGIRTEGPGTVRGLASGIAETSTSVYGLEGIPNAFHHIVVGRAATDWFIYINGIADNLGAGTTTPNTPSGTIIMGDTGLDVYVAHVAVYETALSSTRILAHWNAAAIKATP